MREIDTDEPRQWMTVICYEGRTEAILWKTEGDARRYYERASAQWTESFLTEVHQGWRDAHAHEFDLQGDRWGANPCPK